MFNRVEMERFLRAALLRPGPVERPQPDEPAAICYQSVWEETIGSERRESKPGGLVHSRLSSIFFNRPDLAARHLQRFPNRLKRRQKWARQTKKRRVLYLAAENPADVRMRWIALAQQMDFDPDTIEVFFIEGSFQISQMGDKLRDEAARHGGEFGLVIIDTGPVFYEGDDENNRTQQARHAVMLRELTDEGDAAQWGICLITLVLA